VSEARNGSQQALLGERVGSPKRNSVNVLRILNKAQAKSRKTNHL
jgi:hypothetical protein